MSRRGARTASTKSVVLNLSSKGSMESAFGAADAEIGAAEGHHTTRGVV
jgi:hypothetical protein